MGSAVAVESELLREVLARHAGEPGALLPILHGLQDALGHVPRPLVPRIAQALNLSRAEVHGVVTYYHHFRAAPPAPHVLHVCRAESCRSVGGEALYAHAQLRLGCDAHGTSADGRVTLDAAYCLGLCALSPALMLDGEVHGRVTPAAFDAVIAATRAADHGAAR